MSLTNSTRPAERILLRIPLTHIRASACQPRKHFPEHTLLDLAESIRQHGQLSPLLIRRIGAERFELIAGERRLRALQMLGHTHADAVVISAYDRECPLMALVENLQRENLHYLDEAAAFRTILREQAVTQEQLARSLCISPPTLANRLRLLKLPDSVQDSLRKTGLSERHARALLRLSDSDAQLRLIRESASGHLSVKQLEGRIHRLLSESARSPKTRIIPVVRDSRVVINALLDTVKKLQTIGINVCSRIEERGNEIDVTVTIRRSPD